MSYVCRFHGRDSISVSGFFSHFLAVLAAAATLCVPVAAQTRETLQFSLSAYDAAINALNPGQETVAMGDMLFDVAELKTFRDRIKARLEADNTGLGGFDFSSNKAWPNGVVPYKYDKSMPAGPRITFETAIREWQKSASLNFVPWNGQANHLVIKFTGDSNNAAMNSFLGMRGKAQDLNVAGWGNKIDCAHELGHALGMTHEQCRSDRDLFVRLIATNLSVNAANNINFALVPGSINRTDYDYDSLMHYGRTAFARDGNFPTILAKSPNEKWTDGVGPEEIGQKTHLSAGDIMAMSAQYGAPLTIGGRIVDAAGNPLAGVQAMLTGGSKYRGSNPINTDANGNYSFVGIPKNSGTYTVTPSQPGTSFTVASRPVSIDAGSHQAVDFTSVDAAPPDLRIDVPSVSGVYATTPQASGRASDSVGLKEVRVALARTSDLVWWNWNENTWGTTTFDWATSVRVATGKASWTADLPNLPVGGYQMHVQSVDISDNASPWLFRHFFVDPEPPVVAVGQPIPGSTIPELERIRGTATDGVGTGIRDSKVYFTLYQDGDFWTGFNWKSGTSAQDPEVLLSADVVDGQWIYNSVPGHGHGEEGMSPDMRHGAYFVSLFARDNAGNLSVPTPGVNSVEFTVDHSPPSISITSPADGSTVTNILSISGAATDSKSLETVRLYLFRYGDGKFWDGTAWGGGGSAILPVSTNNGTWTSIGSLPSVNSRNPATRLSNGGYNIIAFAVDSAGNQTRADVTLSVEYYADVIYTAGSYRDANPNNNNDNWDNPANWDGGFVPEDEDVAVVPGGAPTFSGTKVVHGLRFSGGDIRGGKIVIPQDAAMTWSGGTLSADLTIDHGGALFLTGAGDKVIATGRRVENNGASQWDGTSSIHASGAVMFLNNGSITADGNISFVYYNNGVNPVGTFENQGSLTKSGAGTMRFAPEYGGWTLTNGASLAITEGSILVQNQTHLGGTISGAGRLVADGATLHLQSATTLDAGTVELKSGRLVGNGTFTGTGTFHWSGGSLEGDFTIDSDTHFLLSGADRTLASGARVRNRGSAIWESGKLNTSGQSRLENSGRFDINGSVEASYYNNGVHPRGEFENTGLVTINGGANVRFASEYGGLHFNNRGETRVVDGLLTLGGGGVNSNATYHVQSGAIELVPGEPHGFSGRINITGSGTMRVAGASVTGDSATYAIATGSTYEHRSGGATGSFSIEGPGTFIWSGGTLNATIELGATLETLISGNEEKNLESGRIVHSGTATWTGNGGIRAVGQAEFRNVGLFEIQSDAAFTYYNNGVNPVGKFVNTGTIRKTGTAGSTRFLPEYGGWNFFNHGVVQIDTGTLDLNITAIFEDRGTFRGAGITRVIGGTTTVAGTNFVDGGTIEFSNGTLASTEGSLAGTGTFLWTGGAFSGSLNVGVTNFNIRGVADKVLNTGSTIRNLGNAEWSGAGPLRFTGATFIENQGRFNVQEDTALFYYNNGISPRGAFFNSGIFVKSGGTNTTTFAHDYGGTLFNNTGSILVQSGALHLGGGGLWDGGSVAVASQSEVRLFSGEFRLAGGNSFAGPTVVMGAGVVLADGTNTLVANASFHLASGSLTGSGTFAGPGTLDWSGGTIAGTFNISADTKWALKGDAEKRFATGTINNFGQATWTGAGGFKAEGAALLNNYGVFSMQSDSAFTYYNNGINPRGRFNNVGLLGKSGSSGVSFLSLDYGGWQFSNTGTIQIDSGVLSLRTENFLTNSIIKGAGKVQVDGGTVALGGNTTLDGGTFELASGYVHGASTISGTGVFEWTGGELRGTQTIGPGGKMVISGSGEKLVAGSSTLVNNGSLTWTGTGPIRGVGQSRLLNNGVFTILNDAAFGFYNNGVSPIATLENTGVMRKTGSTGRTAFLLEYGGWRFANPGTLEVHAGTFDVGQNYESGPATRLVVSVGGVAIGTGYGTIAFPAPVALNGTLQLLLTNNFVPGTNVFTVATYPSKTGEFVSTALPALPPGQAWKLDYLPNRLELRIEAVVTARNGSIILDANGNFKFVLNGPPGQYALLESTTNLIDWAAIQTNKPFNGDVQFIDPRSSERSKFYRTVIVP